MECDLVVNHSVLTGATAVFGPFDAKVLDIIRLDENGKIVEHWDVLASTVPATSANGKRGGLTGAAETAKRCEGLGDRLRKPSPT